MPYLTQCSAAWQGLSSLLRLRHSNKRMKVGAWYYCAELQSTLAACYSKAVWPSLPLWLSRNRRGTMPSKQPTETPAAEPPNFAAACREV